MHFLREDFNSINEMLDTINQRDKNEIMQDDNASHRTEGTDWFETKSYEEATYLINHGYRKVLDKIKGGVTSNTVRSSIDKRRRVTTGVIGYAPHVPNAILGLPNSMIQTASVAQKVKTVDVVYSPTGLGNVRTDDYIKAGVAMLSAINELETSGIRVNLKVAFKLSFDDNAMRLKGNEELVMTTVKVKDYREHLDILKLCFPLANASMQRRFGFRWLETVPGLQSREFHGGYGSTPSRYMFDYVKNAMCHTGETLLTLGQINKTFNNDYKQVVEYIKNENK